MHVNTPQCAGCLVVLNKYPGFHDGLANWVWEVKKQHVDAHVSWAGRGKADQEAFFKKGTSRAHYGQSAHNFNAAVDWFQLTTTGAYFGRDWYNTVIGPLAHANPLLRWYGEPGVSFQELPHVEWASWKQLAQAGALRLVDGPSQWPMPL